MLNNTPPPTETTDEIDLLDLLLVLADNLKLLVLVPMGFGLLGLTAAYLLPPTFESRSVYAIQASKSNATPDLIASYLRAPRIWLQAGKALQIEPTLSDAELIQKLGSLIAVNIGKQDKLITLSTKGHTPIIAQALNQKLWEFSFLALAPQGQDMDRLRTRLFAEKERLSSSLALEKKTADLLQRSDSSEGTARLYGELLSANSARLSVIASLQAQIEGLTTAGFTHYPSLPETPIQPKKSLITIATTLITGLVVLLFILFRHALRAAAHNPTQAAKIAQIRQNLTLRSKK